MSSPSPSSSEAKWPFDVFLSFRGEDVCRGFLAHLHSALLHGGINAYIDSEDLRPGDEISPALTKAIEDSRIAVLVFSENYALSSWCLDELVKVMECKRLKGQLALPVFYRVEPREILGQRESYGRALARHEEKLGKDSEEVKKWREALIEAASLSGWHYDHGKILLVLDDVDHGDQLNAVARECEWFGKGSRIIITTRDKHVPASHGIDQRTNAVKGIVLDLPTQEELDISPSAFTHMRRLRLLIVLNAQISGGPICLPNDLSLSTCGLIIFHTVHLMNWMRCWRLSGVSSRFHLKYQKQD